MPRRRNLYRDSRGYYHYERMVDGVRFRASAKRAADAEARVEEKIADYRRGQLITGPRQSVAEYLTAWLADVARPSTAPRTYQGYEELIRLHVLPAMGALRLDALTPQHLTHLYADKAKTLSPRRVLHIHRVLHTALQNALGWRYVTSNAAEFAKPPQVPRSERPALDAQQAAHG